MLSSGVAHVGPPVSSGRISARGRDPRPGEFRAASPCPGALPSATHFHSQLHLMFPTARPRALGQRGWEERGGGRESHGRREGGKREEGPWRETPRLLATLGPGHADPHRLRPAQPLLRALCPRRLFHTPTGIKPLAIIPGAADGFHKRRHSRAVTGSGSRWCVTAPGQLLIICVDMATPPLGSTGRARARGCKGT